jgi:hypothetical protein
MDGGDSRSWLGTWAGRRIRRYELAVAEESPQVCPSVKTIAPRDGNQDRSAEGLAELHVRVREENLEVSGEALTARRECRSEERPKGHLGLLPDEVQEEMDRIAETDPSQLPQRGEEACD